MKSNAEIIAEAFGSYIDDVAFIIDGGHLENECKIIDVARADVLRSLKKRYKDISGINFLTDLINRFAKENGIEL